jgi:hypothetical protein
VISPIATNTERKCDLEREFRGFDRISKVVFDYSRNTNPFATAGAQPSSPSRQTQLARFKWLGNVDSNQNRLFGI